MVGHETISDHLDAAESFETPHPEVKICLFPFTDPHRPVDDSRIGVIIGDARGAENSRLAHGEGGIDNEIA